MAGLVETQARTGHSAFWAGSVTEVPLDIVEHADCPASHSDDDVVFCALHNAKRLRGRVAYVSHAGHVEFRLLERPGNGCIPESLGNRNIRQAQTGIGVRYSDAINHASRKPTEHIPNVRMIGERSVHVRQHITVMRLIAACSTASEFVISSLEMD